MEEALAKLNSDLWEKAMDDELLSLKENPSWTSVDLMVDKKPIQCEWVLKVMKQRWRIS